MVQNGNRMQKRKKLKIADQYLIPEFTMSFFDFIIGLIFLEMHSDVIKKREESHRFF